MKDRDMCQPLSIFAFRLPSFSRDGKEGRADTLPYNIRDICIHEEKAADGMGEVAECLMQDPSIPSLYGRA